MSLFQIIVATLNAISPWIFAGGFLYGLLAIYLSTHKNSQFRGVTTYLGHISVFAIGWFLGKWAGLFLISFPILIFYYYMLFHLAMVVVPVCEPYSWEERWQRFRIFVWYQWGNQYPLWIVKNPTGRSAETGIKGKPSGRCTPGLAWAYSHQVVGLTKGITFSGARQSGTVFTQAFERPFDVVDLRTQLRTSWIEVVSSDGIPYKALLFTAFAVDKESWCPSFYHKLLRENPLLKDGKDLDYTKGSYPFSKVRLRALFSTIGVKPSSDSKEPKIVDWDDGVLYQIERSACEILSQKTLDELWTSRTDREGASAMDEIANAIKERCSFQISLRGVNVYSCRIVDFAFEKTEVQEEISDQVKREQIKTWRADWQREAEQTRAEGNAEAEILKQEARAYAYTNLLTAVAEGLQEARHMDPKLPQYVIAVKFISALEKLIEEQPETLDMSEARASLNGVKKLIPWTTNRD
jgi:hypothetical protein